MKQTILKKKKQPFVLFFFKQMVYLFIKLSCPLKEKPFKNKEGEIQTLSSHPLMIVLKTNDFKRTCHSSLFKNKECDILFLFKNKFFFKPLQKLSKRQFF